MSKLRIRKIKTCMAVKMSNRRQKSCKIQSKTKMHAKEHAEYHALKKNGNIFRFQLCNNQKPQLLLEEHLKWPLPGASLHR